MRFYTLLPYIGISAILPIDETHVRGVHMPSSITYRTHTDDSASEMHRRSRLEVTPAHREEACRFLGGREGVALLVEPLARFIAYADLSVESVAVSHSNRGKAALNYVAAAKLSGAPVFELQVNPDTIEKTFRLEIRLKAFPGRLSSSASYRDAILQAVDRINRAEEVTAEKLAAGKKKTSEPKAVTVREATAAVVMQERLDLAIEHAIRMSAENGTSCFWWSELQQHLMSSFNVQFPSSGVADSVRRRMHADGLIAAYPLKQGFLIRRATGKRGRPFRVLEKGYAHLAAVNLSRSRAKR